MSDILVYGAMFVGSLILLVKASDYFTRSAEKIGLYFGMPAFIVGVTIVAVGTSLPELVSSILAVLHGSSEIVVGNVIGSNIANILLVLGIAAIIGKKLQISFELIHVDLPLLFGSSVLLAFSIMDGVFTYKEGILFLVGLLVYLLYTINSGGKATKKEIEEKPKKLSPQTIIVLLVSSGFIFVGAKYTIDSIVKISEILNIGKEIIAVSAVALGTSLPELMVTISAARRGKAEMAVGNVLGSNIFNSFAVMGIPSFFGDLIIPHQILIFSLPVMMVATLLYFFMTQEKQITKWEGWFLVLFYAFFIGKVFGFL